LHEASDLQIGETLDKLLLVNTTVLVTVEHIMQLDGRVRVLLHPTGDLVKLDLHCLVEPTIVLCDSFAGATCFVMSVPTFLVGLELVE
jgi:hypothetical protein